MTGFDIIAVSSEQTMQGTSSSLYYGSRDCIYGECLASKVCICRLTQRTPSPCLRNSKCFFELCKFCTFKTRSEICRSFHVYRNFSSFCTNVVHRVTDSDTTITSDSDRIHISHSGLTEDTICKSKRFLLLNLIWKRFTRFPLALTGQSQRYILLQYLYEKTASASLLCRAECRVIRTDERELVISV